MQHNQEKLKVALYVRVSSEEQKQGHTIDSQILELRQFALHREWPVISVYPDEAWSGAALARPALDRLRDDARKELFDAVLINDVARTNSAVMDRLLLLPRDKENGPEIVNIVSTVASGSQDAEKVLAVIERWDPTERGVGSAYRLLMDTAATADPKRTLAWLRSRIPIAKTNARRRQILVGFQVVAENAPVSISLEDANLFWQFGYVRGHATDEMKRVIASAAGWITQIDESLAREMFLRVFEDRRRESINAAIGSLRTMGSPQFVEFVYGLVLKFTNHQESHATLGHFLEVISQRDFDVRAALVLKIAAPESRALLRLIPAEGSWECAMDGLLLVNTKKLSGISMNRTVEKQGCNSAKLSRRPLQNRLQ
jgi:hypothetical protein